MSAGLAGHGDVVGAAVDGLLHRRAGALRVGRVVAERGQVPAEGVGGRLEAGGDRQDRLDVALEPVHADVGRESLPRPGRRCRSTWPVRGTERRVRRPRRPPPPGLRGPGPPIPAGPSSPTPQARRGRRRGRKRRPTTPSRWAVRRVELVICWISLVWSVDGWWIGIGRSPIGAHAPSWLAALDPVSTAPGADASGSPAAGVASSERRRLSAAVLPAGQGDGEHEGHAVEQRGDPVHARRRRRAADP